LSTESATVSTNLTKSHLRTGAERNAEKNSLVCAAEGTVDAVGGAADATVGGGTESESPPMTGALEAGRFLPRPRPRQALPALPWPDTPHALGLLGIRIGKSL
jgi:hypothetical protein